MTNSKISKEDIDQIRSVINPLLNQSTWNVRLGVGSFLTMEFGKSILVSDNDSRGEWYLWIYCAGWYLENPNGAFIGSEDSREIITRELHILEGRQLVDVLISAVAFETKFVFDEGIILHTFPILFYDNCELWKLFTPEKKVLKVWPTGEWSYVDASI